MVHMGDGSQILIVKDPSAKGHVFYRVPLHLIEETCGFAENVGTGRRPCLCKLYQEGQCRQGAKCRSLHVDREFVQQCRAERGVVLDDMFLSEVAVRTPDGVVLAVRFPAVLRTRGLSSYLTQVQQQQSFPPAVLCPAFAPSGTAQCDAGKLCPRIHIDPAELRGLSLKRLRTPCCGVHGGGAGGTTHGVYAVHVGHRRWFIPACHTAATDGLRGEGCVYEARAVCLLHIQSRCKYGRACRKLHVCRSFARGSGLLSALEAGQGQRDLLPSPPTSSLASTPRDTVPLLVPPPDITPPLLQLPATLPEAADSEGPPSLLSTPRDDFSTD